VHLDVYNYDYDVVIVGCGPAGAYLGYLLSKSGVDVCIIDEKPRESFGNKICGGAIFRHCFEALNFREPMHDCISNVLSITKINFADICDVLYRRPLYIIDRVKFISKIAEMAEKYGANIIDKCRITRPIISNNVVKGVKARCGGQTKEIRARITVDASGVSGIIRNNIHNNIVRWYFSLDEMAGAYRQIVDIKENVGNNAIIYFNQQILRGGYLWIFPMGKTRVNIGLGTLLYYIRPRSLKHLFRILIKRLYGGLIDNGVTIHEGFGFIPVRRPFSMLVWNGLIIIGDAAAQVNPIHAGGICSAMRASKIALSIILAIIERGNSIPTIRDLWRYSYEYNRTEGAKHAIFELARIFLQGTRNKELAIMIPLLKFVSKGSWGIINRYIGLGKCRYSMLVGIVDPRNPARIFKKLKFFAKLRRLIRMHYADYPRNPSKIMTWERIVDALFKEATSHLT